MGIIEKKRKYYKEKISSGGFSIITSGPSVNNNYIKLSIASYKINNLTDDEKRVVADRDVLPDIYLDEMSISNINIDELEDVIKKAEKISIKTNYNFLKKNIDKIKKINACTKRIDIEIVDDYNILQRDYNVINNLNVMSITLPIKYAMWMEIDKILNKNILFESVDSDKYSLIEIKEIKNKILRIIEEIYSDYNNLSDYEKFFLAFDYAKKNWKFKNIGHDLDERGHINSASLFRILNRNNDGKCYSVCAGMSALFQLILNNSKIKVNANVVCGMCGEEPHVWINTIIDDKLYENCLTYGCTVTNNPRIFSKLDERYVAHSNNINLKYKFNIKEYSEIPNAIEDLSISTELKNKNNIYYKDYIITKIGIIKKEDNKFLKLDKKDAVLILKSLMDDIKQKKIFLNLNQNMTINKLLSREKIIVKLDSNSIKNSNESQIIKVVSSQPIDKNGTRIIKVGTTKPMNDEILNENQIRKK